MKFSDAVENLVNDRRAMSIHRTSWKEFSPQTIVFERAYNRLNYAHVPSSMGYSPTLDCILATDWCVTYQEDKSTVSIKIEEAIAKTTEYCYVASFVGGPGDFSPPKCTCSNCIASGRAFKYSTGTIACSESVFEYFWSILVDDKFTRGIRSGIEYHVHATCRILLQPKSKLICIEANKETIRIGKYMCNITKKEIYLNGK